VKGNIKERACKLAAYIIENRATVRDAERWTFEKVLVLEPNCLVRETAALLDITARLRQAGDFF
jgi:hypothetical protein